MFFRFIFILHTGATQPFSLLYNSPPDDYTMVLLSILLFVSLVSSYSPLWAVLLWCSFQMPHDTQVREKSSPRGLCKKEINSKASKFLPEWLHSITLLQIVCIIKDNSSWVLCLVICRVTDNNFRVLCSFRWDHNHLVLWIFIYVFSSEKICLWLAHFIVGW